MHAKGGGLFEVQSHFPAIYVEMCCIAQEHGVAPNHSNEYSFEYLYLSPLTKTVAGACKTWPAKQGVGNVWEVGMRSNSPLHSQKCHMTNAFGRIFAVG
jgi:hypothetical protein